jgi:hypothetical protein
MDDNLKDWKQKRKTEIWIPATTTTNAFYFADCQLIIQDTSSKARVPVEKIMS